MCYVCARFNILSFFATPISHHGPLTSRQFEKNCAKSKDTLAALLSIFVPSDIQFSSFHTTHNNAARLGDNCNDKWLLSCHFNWFWLLHTYNAFNKKIWARRFSHKLDGKLLSSETAVLTARKKQSEYCGCQKNTAFSFTSNLHSKILSYLSSGNQEVSADKEWFFISHMIN